MCKATPKAARIGLGAAPAPSGWLRETSAAREAPPVPVLVIAGMSIVLQRSAERLA
jgi:hypothetical protein